MLKEEKGRELSLTIGGRQFSARRIWNTEREEWFYSITDLIAILVPDSPDPNAYWRKLNSGSPQGI